MEDLVERFSTDIGWSLAKFNTKTYVDGRRRYNKVCNGIVVCDSKNCGGYGKEIRPASTKKGISKQTCDRCGGFMTHKPCKASVSFTYDLANFTCTMQNGVHNHKREKTFLRYHLTVDEEKAFNDLLKADPLTTPSKMTTGISSQTGEITKPTGEINPSLANQDKTKYHMNKTKSQDESLSKTNNGLLGQLERLFVDFEGYIIYAQVSPLANFLVAFSCPLLQEYKLPFETFPIITDVTYKAMSGEEGKYLCSSVIFVPEIKKSIVVFIQAIIGGLSAEYFTEYFILLFKTFKLTKNFLGMLMDFSAAQRQGFLSAFNKYFNNNNNGGGTVHQINEARSFLKGCFMHWMQRCQSYYP